MVNCHLVFIPIHAQLPEHSVLGRTQGIPTEEIIGGEGGSKDISSLLGILHGVGMLNDDLRVSEIIRRGDLRCLDARKPSLDYVSPLR